MSQITLCKHYSKTTQEQFMVIVSHIIMLFQNWSKHVGLCFNDGMVTIMKCSISTIQKGHRLILYDNTGRGKH